MWCVSIIRKGKVKVQTYSMFERIRREVLLQIIIDYWAAMGTKQRSDLGT